MLTPESAVLNPIDPSITNPDDYEIYTLSEARVFFQNGKGKQGKLANLLDAYADTPLRVEGRLEQLDRAQMKYAVKKPFRPIDIEITDVTRFSYGQTSDGEVVIWALGKAGWFELRPARDYKEVFADTLKAVEILYFVTDIYNKPRKRGGGPGAPLVFQEYAEDKRFDCNDPTAAMQIFYQHRAFLIMCFLNRAQGIGWSNTPLAQYFKRQFSQEWETTKARVEGKLEQDQGKTTKAKAQPAPPVKSTSRTKSKPEIPKKTPDAPKKDDNWWEAAAIFTFMQKAVNLGAMHIHHMTLEKLAKLIVKRYEIDDVETAKNFVLVHAPNLRYMMEYPKRKSIQYFTSEAIYEELCVEHKLPAVEVRRVGSIELRPRKDHSSLKEDAESESDSSSSLETPKRQPRHKKRGRLSVLRPKSSKFSGKGKGVAQPKGKGKGKAPNVDISTDSESEDEAHDAEAAASESEMEVDTPIPAGSPGKRKRSGTIDTNPRKRAASASVEPQPSSPTASSSDDSDAPTEPLPLKYRPNGAASKSSGPPVLPTLVSSPLPEYTANGPGDSWICDFDGCSRKVYGASTDVGRGLIKEHLVDHSRGRHTEVNILLREEQKLRLPVNNLLKRIREMSEQQQPLFPSMGPPATAIQHRPVERLA